MAQCTPCITLLNKCLQQQIYVLCTGNNYILILYYLILSNLILYLSSYLTLLQYIGIILMFREVISHITPGICVCVRPNCPLLEKGVPLIRFSLTFDML